MNKLRWDKHFWSNWAGDPALAACSLAAQGLWTRLLAIAAQGEPYGHVNIAGKTPSIEQIAKLVRARPFRVARWIAELEEKGVAERDKDGCLVNRAMVRDSEIALVRQNAAFAAWSSDTRTIGEPERAAIMDSSSIRAERLRSARLLGRHTEDQWQHLLCVCHFRCVRCGNSGIAKGGLVRDHIVPIYQGGSDGIENIQPLCQSCNSRKGANSTDYRPIGALDE